MVLLVRVVVISVPVQAFQFGIPVVPLPSVPLCLVDVLVMVHQAVRLGMFLS